MGIFLGNKNKEKLMLVFDIRSSSAGGALFLMQKSGIPKIIFSVREPIILQETLDVDKFLSSTVKSLEIVADKVYKAGMGKPEAVFCVLSSPWHISQTRIARLEKNTPFLFTSKLALDLIKKEIALFEEEYSAKYKDVKNAVRSIEFKNIKIMLNGYETPNPLDQKAKELEMAVFISISPEQVLRKIEKTVEKFFHFKNIKFSSFSLASYTIVRDIYAHNEDFLLVDIGGEVTDIALAKKNALRESISFPLGYNFIARRIASFLHLPLNEARSLFSLFKDGHASESMAKKFIPVIDKLKMEWLNKFQESLANLSNDISIPSTIYVAVDKDEADFFCQIIETEQFSQYSLTDSKFKVIFLSTEIFHSMAEFKSNTIRDTFLIIDSIYVCRFLTKNL